MRAYLERDAHSTRSDAQLFCFARKCATIGLFFLAAIMPDAAMAQSPGGPSSGLATRSVSKYLDVERGLEQALAEHRQDTLSELLDADFQLRSSANPDTFSRQEWLQDVLKASRAPGQIQDLSVFEADDLAIVSFLVFPRSKHGKEKSAPRFIVDVWRQSTGKLQIRYSDVTANPSHMLTQPNVRD